MIKEWTIRLKTEDDPQSPNKTILEQKKKSAHDPDVRTAWERTATTWSIARGAELATDVLPGPVQSTRPSERPGAMVASNAVNVAAPLPRHATWQGTNEKFVASIARRRPPTDVPTVNKLASPLSVILIFACIYHTSNTDFSRRDSVPTVSAGFRQTTTSTATEGHAARSATMMEMTTTTRTQMTLYCHLHHPATTTTTSEDLEVMPVVPPESRFKQDSFTAALKNLSSVHVP